MVRSLTVAAAVATSTIMLTRCCPTASAFTPPTPACCPSARRRSCRDAAARPPAFSPTGLRASSSSASATGGDAGGEVEADIEKMRATEIRKELQSMGVSTKSFFEKSELVDALKKARAEGRKPGTATGTADGGAAGGGSGASSASGGVSRDDRIKEEMEKLKSLKVGELKKELRERGVSTNTFFEKSEFVRALAEARVDGVTTGAGAGTGAAGSRGRQQEEEYDPSYRDVQCSKFTPDPLRMGSGPIIDIRLP